MYRNENQRWANSRGWYNGYPGVGERCYNGIVVGEYDVVYYSWLPMEIGRRDDDKFPHAEDHVAIDDREFCREALAVPVPTSNRQKVSDALIW